MRCLRTSSAWLALVLLWIGWGELRISAQFAGTSSSQQLRGDAVADWVLHHDPFEVDSPGGALFDAEWAYGTCLMTVLGLGQIILEHPELSERYQPAMDRCAGWLLTPESRAFGTQKWGHDGLLEPTAGPDHAYLGYANAALGMHRAIYGDALVGQAHDQLTQGILADLQAPASLWETYPGEVYPPDQAVAAGSVGLHGRVTGTDHSAVLDDWAVRWRAAAIDPQTGMLHQHLDGSGQGTGARGSGTAWAAYFVAFADPTLSAELTEALAHQPLGPLGGVREYPWGVRGWGDIDSGPVIFGRSVAATGFALGAVRTHGDAARYRQIRRTAGLAGLRWRGWYYTGGAIGNAILLAMETAQPVDALTTRIHQRKGTQSS